MKYEFAINETELKEIKDIFWLIHCDETRDDPIGNRLTYNVLVSLEAYRKHALGIVAANGGMI